MYALVIVLMLNGMYSVQAPNLVFPDLETCERMKELNTKVLRDTAPNDSAKFYAVCVKVNKDIEV